MRKLAIFTFAAGLGLATLSANALPIAPIATDNAAIAKVAYGCGPGWTRGPYGHCRPRFTCPPGWHSGPEGFHCFRNHW